MPTERSQARRAPRARPTLTFGVAALGFARASSGPLAVVSIATAALTVLIAAAVSVAVARDPGDPPLVEAASVSASALAWGAGIMLAFGASSGALRRDRDEGVLALARARGASEADYAFGRVIGLAAVLALIVAGGGLVVALAGLFAAPPRGVGAAARGIAVAVAYGLAFAAVIAPVAMAALGARARVAGHLTLVAVLVVPELAASALGPTVSPALTEVMSIPRALNALRAGLVADGLDLARVARGAIALALVVVVALALFARGVRRALAEPPA